MRCLSLEKRELHSAASSEIIAGDRSEVKRLVQSVTTWILQDPCITIATLFYQPGRKGKPYFGVFLYTGCSQILTSETDGIVTNLSIRAPALVERTRRHCVAQDIYAEYDAVYQRFGDTCCVHY